MNDEQIEFLKSVLKLTKMKIFLKDDGILIPVLSIQTDFIDKDSDFGEPVACLNNGKCAALSCVGSNDFVVIVTENKLFHDNIS